MSVEQGSDTYADWQPATMAGVLWLLIVGLGALTQKNSPGDEPWGVKECEAACACRSPVTQKSRSQARPPLDASQQSSALASEDYSSQSDEKTNTKPGVGGDARASLNEDDRHECVPQL